MLNLVKYHKGPFLFALVTLCFGFLYGFHLSGAIGGAISVVFLMMILSVLEISLSFDNAIVNAKILEKMSAEWQHRFLTWGMLIAVFGLRIVFPVLIVAVVSGLSMVDATLLAVNDHVKYSEILQSSRALIAGFGGAFLFLVAFEFFFDAEKDVHWIHSIESKLVKLGARQSVGIVLTVGLLYTFYSYLPEYEALKFFMSGIAGIVTHEIVKLIGDLMNSGEDEENNATVTVAKNGLASFLYLEVLDASFSFDGVLGALVISTDIFIIAGGLAIGAMAVRSLTIQLVESGTLNEYKYLEHSAFYAIFILASIMFASTLIHIPELITGLLSVSFIAAGYISSIRVKD